MRHAYRRAPNTWLAQDDVSTAFASVLQYFIIHRFPADVVPFSVRVDMETASLILAYVPRICAYALSSVSTTAIESSASSAQKREIGRHGATSAHCIAATFLQGLQQYGHAVRVRVGLHNLILRVIAIRFPTESQPPLCRVSIGGTRLKRKQPNEVNDFR
jgi:hypothetical protein